MFPSHYTLCPLADAHTLNIDIHTFDFLFRQAIQALLTHRLFCGRSEDGSRLAVGAEDDGAALDPAENFGGCAVVLDWGGSENTSGGGGGGGEGAMERATDDGRTEGGAGTDARSRSNGNDG